MPKYIINPVFSESVSMVREYLQSIDLNGLSCFESELDQLISDDDCMDLLTEVLRSRFYVDVLMESGTSYDPLHVDRLEERQACVDGLEKELNGRHKDGFNSLFHNAFEFALLNIRSEDMK